MIDPLFIACAAIAAILVGLAKSGFAAGVGAAAVPLLALVMPTPQAAGVMLPVLLVLDAAALIIYRREVNWKIFRIIIPGAMAGTLIGWGLSAVVNESAVGLVLGVVSVVFALDAWLPLRRKLEQIPASRPWGWFWGTVAGFTSFISHTGGPPYQVYTMPLRLAPNIYAGTAAVVFAAINAAKLIPYYMLGQLSVPNLELALGLLPVAGLGMLAGVWMVRRIPAKVFYQIAYVLIFLLGLKLIYSGVTAIFLTGIAA